MMFGNFLKICGVKIPLGIWLIHQINSEKKIFRFTKDKKDWSDFTKRMSVYLVIKIRFIKKKLKKIKLKN